MKKLNLLVAGLVCFATLSCSDDDKTSEVDNTNVTAVEDAMQTGSWKITSFIEEGNDETAHLQVIILHSLKMERLGRLTEPPL